MLTARRHASRPLARWQTDRSPANRAQPGLLNCTWLGPTRPGRPNLVRTGREQPHGMLRAGVDSGSPPCTPWTVSCPQRSRRRHARSSDGTAGRSPRGATGLIDRHPMPMAPGPSGRPTDCPWIANRGDQRWPAVAGCTSATGSAERAGHQGLPVGISPWSVRGSVGPRLGGLVRWLTGSTEPWSAVI